MPNPPDTSHWNEYDWEKYLRENDRYAAHFFELLKRFCDLPGARELIARKMDREFKGDMLDCNFECDRCEHRWDCEFSNLEALDEEMPPDETSEQPDEEPTETHPPGPGDALFYETDPAFVVLRQTAIGWCNVYAAILPPDARVTGLKILFHIGRALANLAYSIGDGTFDQPAASIALAKRSLFQVNAALGILAQLIQEKPRLEKILEAMKTHFLRCHQALGDHLQRCRAKLPAGDAGTAEE